MFVIPAPFLPERLPLQHGPVHLAFWTRLHQPS